MDYSAWMRIFERNRRELPDKDDRIYCQHCLKETGITWHGLAWRVIPRGGLKCPHCKNVVIEGPKHSLCV